MIYEHRANQVKAFVWGTDPEPDWFKEFVEEAKPERQFAANSLFLPTAMGEKHVQPGCYVFIDPDGYIDAEPEHIFKQNYQPVESVDTDTNVGINLHNPDVGGLE